MWAGGDSEVVLLIVMSCLGKDCTGTGCGISTQEGRRWRQAASISFPSKQEVPRALEWPGACNEVIYVKAPREKIAVGLFLIYGFGIIKQIASSMESHDMQSPVGSVDCPHLC